MFNYIISFKQVNNDLKFKKQFENAHTGSYHIFGRVSGKYRETCSNLTSLHHMIDMIPTFKMLDIYYIKHTYSRIRSGDEIHVILCHNLVACK